MIGNLGKVVYTHISKDNENYGNNGNCHCKPPSLLPPHKEAGFPLAENGTGTVGTATSTTLRVPAVPERKYSYGNQRGHINSIDNQPLVKNVPVVPAVPVINADAPMKQTACYWCKSHDLWRAGTEQYPHWVCRNCHPPAPGAELKPNRNADY